MPKGSLCQSPQRKYGRFGGTRIAFPPCDSVHASGALYCSSNTNSLICTATYLGKVLLSKTVGLVAVLIKDLSSILLSTRTNPNPSSCHSRHYRFDKTLLCTSLVLVLSLVERYPVLCLTNGNNRCHANMTACISCKPEMPRISQFPMPAELQLSHPSCHYLLHFLTIARSFETTHADTARKDTTPLRQHHSPIEAHGTDESFRGSERIAKWA